MIDLTQREVLLYKVLVSLFGKENVIPKMSLRTMCENIVDSHALMKPEDANLQLLFTIVNHDDTPKLVVEFAPEVSECIDLYALEREKIVTHFLTISLIRYITISDGEYEDLIHPAHDRSFLINFFKDKCGLTLEEDEEVP